MCVLIAGAFDEEPTTWQRILGRRYGQEQYVKTWREAHAFLQRSRVRVVVCERDLPDGNWRDVLESATRLSHPPAVIVASRLADERLWLDVLVAGGYDVLPRPLDAAEAGRTIVLAHASSRAGVRTARLDNSTDNGGYYDV